MNQNRPPIKPSWIKRVWHWLHTHRHPSTVPAELQQAINACQTVEELKQLLFSIDFILDEACINAFDEKLDALLLQSLLAD